MGQLTEFKRNNAKLARHAKDRIEAIEGIRRGLQSMKSNAGKPAAKFFREFFAEKGIAEEE
jgi:hypothetical protein